MSLKVYKLSLPWFPSWAWFYEIDRELWIRIDTFREILTQIDPGTKDKEIFDFYGVLRNSRLIEMQDMLISAIPIVNIISNDGLEQILDVTYLNSASFKQDRLKIIAVLKSYSNLLNHGCYRKKTEKTEEYGGTSL